MFHSPPSPGWTFLSVTRHLHDPMLVFLRPRFARFPASSSSSFGRRTPTGVEHASDGRGWGEEEGAPAAGRVGVRCGSVRLGSAAASSSQLSRPPPPGWRSGLSFALPCLVTPLSLVLSLLLLAPSAHFRGRGGRAIGDCGEQRGTICDTAAPRAAAGHSYAEERERDGRDRSIEGPAVAEARARVSLAARAAVRGATIAARPSERRQRSTS